MCAPLHQGVTSHLYRSWVMIWYLIHNFLRINLFENSNNESSSLLNFYLNPDSCFHKTQMCHIILFLSASSWSLPYFFTLLSKGKHMKIDSCTTPFTMYLSIQRIDYIHSLQRDWNQCLCVWVTKDGVDFNKWVTTSRASVICYGPLKDQSGSIYAELFCKCLQA